MKKIISVFMTLLLLWSLTLPAAAAEAAAATTLRLEKAEGTVKVSNASGKSVTVTEGMRLYSGYTVSTEKNSYAYISLDSDKAVKLDASSKGVVQKSGKKLELAVTAGKLFFNVSAPLEKDESLNIRTSTMVTGVRGTSGWVEVTNRSTSSVQLLEGSLTVTSTEPATGQIQQATITGGQSATAALNKPSQAGSQMSLTVTNLLEKQVPGFVAVEVAANPTLQGKIAAKSPLSIPAIIGGAQERLENEQASANAADQNIQKDLNKIAAVGTNQVFTGQQEETGGSGGGSSGGSSNTPPVNPPVDPPVDPPEKPTNPTMTLDSPAAAELKAALETPSVTNVIVTNAEASELSAASYTVSDGQTLDIQSGTFDVGSGQTLEVTSGGTLQNSGTVNVAGTMIISGTAYNDGTITITSTDSIHVKKGGSLTNTDAILVGDGTNPGLLDIQAGGTLINKGEKAMLKISTTTNDTVSSQVVNAGTFTNSGSFSVGDGTLFACPGIYNEERPEFYAMIKGSDDVVRYLGLASGVTAWQDSTTVKLLGGKSGGTLGPDPSPDQNYQFYEFDASGVTLDLNGHRAELLSGLTIPESGGNLTITDSSVGKTGKLALADTAAGNTVTVSGGSLTLSGGTVAGGAKGFGINALGGTVTISGGTVSCDSDGGIAVMVDNANAQGTVAVTGGEITSSGTGGTAMQVSSGTATISGGRISASGTRGIGMVANGGVINVSDGEVSSANSIAMGIGGGEVNISGGKVTGTSGNGIEERDGVLTMTGGEVTGGNMGISVSGGELTMWDGTVSSNNVGISVSGEMTGNVEISGGSVSGGSYGVYIDETYSLEFSVNISGGTVSSTGGTAILASSGAVTVSGGAVTGYSCGIQNSGNAKVTISGTAVITLTAEPSEDGILTGYTVSGPFTFSGGTLRANSPKNLYQEDYCDMAGTSSGVEESENGGYYTISVTPSS